MLHIVSWLWGDKWPPIYAERLFAAVRRNLKQPHRCVLMTDRFYCHGADSSYSIDKDDAPYLTKPGCLARMRMFDERWQKRTGVISGDRVVSIDIDCVITGTLDHLFDRDDEFTITQGYNSTNPCPFNGSLWMFRAGERHDVWDDFSLDAHRKFNVPIHAIADDQGWLHYKFPQAQAYTPQDGVYCFKKKTWPQGKQLPHGACLVAFPGRDPNKYADLPWVKEHWGDRC